MPPIHPDRGPAAAARLAKALELLKRSNADAPHQAVTISELCRSAGVSRNALYRYHPAILADLRVQQGRSDAPPDRSTASSCAPDHALLQDRLSKLAALVDHYYAAYRETRALLERRDRQLAELRRKLDRAPDGIASLTARKF